LDQCLFLSVARGLDSCLCFPCPLLLLPSTLDVTGTGLGLEPGLEWGLWVFTADCFCSLCSSWVATGACRRPNLVYWSRDIGLGVHCFWLLAFNLSFFSFSFFFSFFFGNLQTCVFGLLVISAPPGKLACWGGTWRSLPASEKLKTQNHNRKLAPLSGGR
jgi:hypothetical protein